MEEHGGFPGLLRQIEQEYNHLRLQNSILQVWDGGWGNATMAVLFISVFVIVLFFFLISFISFIFFDFVFLSTSFLT